MLALRKAPHQSSADCWPLLRPASRRPATPPTPPQAQGSGATESASSAGVSACSLLRSPAKASGKHVQGEARNQGHSPHLLTTGCYIVSLQCNTSGGSACSGGE